MTTQGILRADFCYQSALYVRYRAIRAPVSCGGFWPNDDHLPAPRSVRNGALTCHLMIARLRGVCSNWQQPQLNTMFHASVTPVIRVMDVISAVQVFGALHQLIKRGFWCAHFDDLGLWLVFGSVVRQSTDRCGQCWRQGGF